jgi:hypothetical protein
VPSFRSLTGTAGRFTAEITLRAALDAARPKSDLAGPVDVFLCLVDHYEPHVGRASDAMARERHSDWLRRYPAIAGAHRDADGRHPTHTFCYPWDECDDWELKTLAELCAAGWGEVEVHLHHADDTSDGLRRKLRDAVAAYRARGALTAWPDGRPAFGFVHGNWALDNSRLENGRNYCGVNDELTVLQQEGCYADFTFPAWGQTAQPRQLNSLFYAVDDPARPKSYDRGTPARVGESGAAGLLIVQGPLVPFFRRGKRVPLGMDDSDLAAYRRYDPSRLDRWVRAGIHVLGRRDRVFVKLHCHGAEDANRAAMLGEDLHALFADAEARYNDGRRYRLHYVTAREMFNVIKATEAGVEDLLAARDYVLPPPGEAAGARALVGMEA